MSWCDKLASTPGVGFGLEAHYTSVAAIQDALAPVLDKHAHRDSAEFQLDEVNDPFNFAFTTNDGFQYGIQPSRVFVSFRHRLKIKQVSAGLPTIEMTSVSLPFSELLPEVSQRLIDATLALPEAEKREVFRVGVFTQTVVDKEQAPPGILRFIDYIARPWNGLTDSFALQITTEVEKSEDYRDRCIHTLHQGEKDDELLQINLDFQREYKKGQHATKDVLRNILSNTERGALAYFEDLAEGNRFDEDILRNSAES